MVRVQRRLPNAHQTKRAVYRARLRDGDIADLFMNAGGQSVKVTGPETAEVSVVAVRPDSPALNALQGDDPPAAADKQASVMIQSDDPRVVALARSVAPQETDAWALARQLEQFVKRSIRLKNYSTAMATAAEVAVSREGDCTEHSVLLAALCRARGIPARVAVGLVYYPPSSAFAYHMWTEVWIQDRWVPLYATLGLGGTGAAHLKFSHSSLQGTGAYAEMLPVIQAIGRLHIDVVSVDSGH
jgi:transglutaminase-like putative cysteine protease